MRRRIKKDAARLFFQKESRLYRSGVMPPTYREFQQQLSQTFGHSIGERRGSNMGKTTHYGKPSNYPYHFVVSEGKRKIFWSGTFKTKKKCRQMAKEYASSRKGYRYKVIDRRK